MHKSTRADFTRFVKCAERIILTLQEARLDDCPSLMLFDSIPAC